MGKRGTKPGSKRGSYLRHSDRLFNFIGKTTTREGKREYQRLLMRKRRGTSPERYGKRGRKPKRTLLKEMDLSLKSLDQKLRELG